MLAKYSAQSVLLAFFQKEEKSQQESILWMKLTEPTKRYSAWAGLMVLLLRKGGNDDDLDEEAEEWGGGTEGEL